MTFLAVMSTIIAAFGFAGYKLYVKPYSEPEESANPTPMPPTPSQSPETVPSSPVQTETTAASGPPMIDRFCLAIRDFEGGPGSLNYILNNPGDCRPSPIGYLPKYEPVEIVDTDTDPRYPFHKGKFAKFPTYELGWEYLQALVLNWAHVQPEWTILDFFTNYSPASDSNPTQKYAEFVASHCGKTVETTLKEVFI